MASGADDDGRFAARCTIIGGPNGSGKSAIYSLLDPPGEYVSADLFAKSLNPENPEAASLQAGRIAIRRLDELISEGASFAYETTLSSRQAMNLMRRARREHYQVGLAFVVLQAPD